MPVCSSGTSGPRTGLSESVIISAAFAPRLIPAGLRWLLPFFEASAGVIVLDLPSFCAVDPPADPGLSAADLLAVATAAPEFENPGARDRVLQLIERYAWYAVCQCNSVLTPAPPAAPSPPANAPQINPPGVGGIDAAPCYVESGTTLLNQTTRNVVDVFLGTPCDTTGNPLCSSIARPIPAGAHSAEIFMDLNQVTSPQSPFSGDAQVRIYFYNGTTLLGTSGVFFDTVGTAGQPPWSGHSAVVPIPAGSTGYGMHGLGGSNGGAFTATATIQFFCDTGPTIGPQPPCCTASDPVTTGLLRTILEQVNLIQRQAVPFAYITGTVHSGLTGTGTIAVSGILGLLANISVPSSTGEIAGTPLVNLPIGRLNLATADGYEDRIKLVTTSQLIVPQAMGLVTLIGYSLEPGVTMTLTELVREP